MTVQNGKPSELLKKYVWEPPIFGTLYAELNPVLKSDYSCANEVYLSSVIIIKICSGILKIL